MILKKRHIIACKVADEFRDRMRMDHSELLKYPLKYLNFQVAVCEQFGIIIDEIPALSVRKVRSKLAMLGLQFDPEAYDDYLQLAGFLYASDGAVIIFIEQTDIEERKKFTLAHELSHFLNEFFKIQIKLNRRNQLILPLFEVDHLKSLSVIAKRCTKNDVFSLIYNSKEADFSASKKTASIESLIAQKQIRQDNLRERICDWFAAELLMPIHILKELERQWIAEGHSLDLMIENIQQFFEVSFHAAKVRAEELSLGVISQDTLIE
jgi:Zn-dependent peptidase ImmA (M78 family)